MASTADGEGYLKIGWTRGHCHGGTSATELSPSPASASVPPSASTEQYSRSFHGDSRSSSGNNNIPAPRRSHSAVLWRQNKMVLFGGYSFCGENFNDTYILDCSTGEWQQMQCWGTIPPGMCDHSAVIVEDEMIVYGGFTARGKSKNTYVLDLHIHKWRLVSPVTTTEGECPEEIDGHVCVVLTKEVFGQPTRILIFGGRNNSWLSNNTVWILHLDSLRWERVNTGSPAPCKRVGHCGDIWLHDGNRDLVMFAGYDDGGQFIGRLNDTWALNLDTFKWRQLSCTGNIPDPVSNHKGIVLPDLFSKGGLVTFGGWGHDKVEVNTFSILDLEKCIWHRGLFTTEPPLPRRNYSLVPYGQSLLLYGGYRSAYTFDELLSFQIFSAGGHNIEVPPVYQEVSEFPLDSLPDRDLVNVFTYGTGADYLNWTLVSRKWRTLLSSAKLWRLAASSLWIARTTKTKSDPVLASYLSKITNKALIDFFQMYTKNATYKFWKLNFQIIQECIRATDMSNERGLQCREFRFSGCYDLFCPSDEKLWGRLVHFFPQYRFLVAVFITLNSEYPLIKGIIIHDSGSCCTQPPLRLPPCAILPLLIVAPSSVTFSRFIGTRCFLSEITQCSRTIAELLCLISEQCSISTTKPQGSQTENSTDGTVSFAIAIEQMQREILYMDFFWTTTASHCATDLSILLRIECVD
ncbi:kelch motif protein [Pelomyxa schiedti]|nr:kelch motif protein [Pelomyxa schiedti]